MKILKSQLKKIIKEVLLQEKVFDFDIKEINSAVRKRNDVNGAADKITHYIMNAKDKSGWNGDKPHHSAIISATEDADWNESATIKLLNALGYKASAY